jgi:energy-coupling factor transporter ATP-binding protein EcfA2
MITGQAIEQITIKQLKNLRDVTITLDSKKCLTALLGPNGCGKSTLLHLLASCFSQSYVRAGNTGQDKGETRLFSNFFAGTPHATWSGTNADVIHKFINEGATQPSRATLKIRKKTAGWTPQPSSRPPRETYFIGVSTASPDIETLGGGDDVRYQTVKVETKTAKKILDILSYVFNRNYTELNSHEVGREKPLIGLTYDRVSYSSLAMGALILIDELDLLFHTDALNRFLQELEKIARSKDLQIIFTSHREQIASFSDTIAVRHLYRSLQPPYQTLVFDTTKPDALFRLTGVATRPLRVSGEDVIAKSILTKVAGDLGLLRHVEVLTYGSAENCYTLAAALVMNKDPKLANNLLVLDGDVNCDANARKRGVAKVLNGTEVDIEERQKQAIDRIVQFRPLHKENPEQALHGMVKEMPTGIIAGDDEVIRVAQEIQVVRDKHNFVNKVVERLGVDYLRGVDRMIEVASKSVNWPSYTVEIREWLESKRNELEEKHN